MIDFTQNPPTWIHNGQPVQKTVQRYVQKGMIKQITPEEESSGYNFNESIKRWADRLAPGVVFNRQDWLDHAMAESGASGMDLHQAVNAWKNYSQKIKKRLHKAGPVGPNNFKCWVKC
jgi:hypothetical protein